MRTANPLDVGRKQRTVSTPLKRALYARDRGCTFPGCHRKRYVDGHHLKHWINGGETTPDNMTLLCTHHHKKLHEGGFSIVKDADDTLRFVTADGRTIPRCGYRLEDFVDDDIGDETESVDENPSREGFCTTTVQRGLRTSGSTRTAAVGLPTTANRERAQRPLNDDRQRRLVEHRALLEQRLHVLLPVTRFVEPRKRARERGIVPAAREPRRVMHESQGA